MKKIKCIEGSIFGSKEPSVYCTVHRERRRDRYNGDSKEKEVVPEDIVAAQ
jgi:hypothetical protein